MPTIIGTNYYPLGTQHMSLSLNLSGLRKAVAAIKGQEASNGDSTTVSVRLTNCQKKGGE